MSKPIGERDIFGGSDSELSSDEEAEIQRQKSSRSRDSASARAAAPADDESSAASEEDDYKEERLPTGVKRQRRPRARRIGEEEGAERAVRKRKRRERETENLDDLTPEQRQKRELDMKIDAILKPSKGKRKQSKKKGDEEVLDRFADEEVSRLRESMLNAAEEDEAANREKLPAVAKLRLLPQVMDVLRKSALEQSITDNNLLEGVKKWLDPLPDKSLPALNIQQEFFRALPDMKFIDSSVLKESGLGRVVLFYTKCKRVTPEIQRIANGLVSKWSRPIIKRSASYRDRIVPTAETGSQPRAAADRLNAILARAREEDKLRTRKNAVAIPNSQLGNYTVAPSQAVAPMRGTTSVDMDVQRRKANAERLRSLTRKVTFK